MPTRSAFPVVASSPSAIRWCPQNARPATRHATTAGATHRRDPAVSDRPGRCGGRRRHQRRQPEHAGNTRELREGQHRHLAVAKQDPGESPEEGQPAILAGHPHRRRQPDPRAAVPCDEQVKPEGKQRGKQREVGDKQAGDTHRQREREAAKPRHHAAGPVHRAGKVDQPCQQAQHECVARAHRPATRGADRHRDDERRQRHPPECRMSVAREAERQRDARGDG